MVLARQHLFISLVSAQTESGWSNLGVLLARQHLFISLASPQTESGWSNLGMLLATQHLYIFFSECTERSVLMVHRPKLAKSVELQSRIHKFKFIYFYIFITGDAP